MSLTVLIISIILVEIISQYLLEKSITGDNTLLYLGMLFYALVGYIYYLILKSGEKLAIANSIWNASSTIGVAIVGYFIFKQKLSFIQVMGLLLTLVGVYLISDSSA